MGACDVGSVAQDIECRIFGTELGVVFWQLFNALLLACPACRCMGGWVWSRRAACCCTAPPAVARRPLPTPLPTSELGYRLSAWGAAMFGKGTCSCGCSVCADLCGRLCSSDACHGWHCSPVERPCHSVLPAQVRRALPARVGPGDCERHERRERGQDPAAVPGGRLAGALHRLHWCGSVGQRAALHGWHCGCIADGMKPCS